MSFQIKKIALAVAFSPTAPAMLAEAARLSICFNAKLVVIHVGAHAPESEQKMDTLLRAAGLSADQVIVLWRKGDPVKEILKSCKEEHVDLLLAGALRKENLMNHYLGTVARKIMHKADCSVLLLLTPSVEPKPFSEIVANADDGPYVQQTLTMACSLSKVENPAWLHIVREIKMYGLTVTSSEHYSEEEYSQLKTDLVATEINNVQKMLDGIPHEGLKINIKILAGKSGFEAAQFAIRKQADLLIMAAPERKFSLFDRVFPHDQEYIFADLPCNLLIVNPGKEGKRG